MMDIDTDILVEDADIVASTEINDAQTSVDPAVFAIREGAILTSPGMAKEISPSSKDVAYDIQSPTPGPLPPTFLDHRASSEDSLESIDFETFYTPPLGLSTVEVVIPPRRFEPLPYSSTQSGLVYDVRMRFHTEPPSSILGEDDIHPEDPRRIYAIYQALVEAGLVYDEGSEVVNHDFQLYRIEARNALPAEICLVHTRDHFLWVKNLQRKSDEELQHMAAVGDSIYLHKLTYDCALLAAGGAIEACRAVVAGNVRNAIAVIRPPGHHAEHDVAGGFCFFNNVCIAARVCQRDYPRDCRKILILDWDVHHGNGIQNAFYDDPNILYISLHVHKNGTFYPFGPKGDHQHCGEGPGLGRNVNIPWADVGMGDGDYLFAFQQVVIPIAAEFDPDLVLVSAGFDAAEGDLLGACHVSPPCYAHMTHMLMSLAKGKVAVCLEGGYNLSSIAKSALAVTRTLMGEPPDRLLDIEPTALGVSTVQLVKAEQSRYWKCMYPRHTATAYADGVKSERLHDVIRAWQSKVMFDEFHMSTLEIYRDRVSKSFDDQVLATPNYAETLALLVILHDPPVVQGMPDPKTARLDLHKYWLTDASKSYIDWAVQHDFGVIDVNVPKHITDPQDCGGHVLIDDPETRSVDTKELITYLWENYIEVSKAINVFFLGVGTAHDAVIHLLSTQDNCEQRISHVFGFLAGNAIHPVKRPTDEYISRWYYENSHIFVNQDHAAWDPDRTRKLRRKFGKLVRSSKTDLDEILIEHRQRVIDILWQQTEEIRNKNGVGKRAGSTEEEKISTFQPHDPIHLADAPLAMQSVSGASISERGGTKSPVKLPPIGYFSVSPRREVRERTGSPRTPSVS